MYTYGGYNSMAQPINGEPYLFVPVLSQTDKVEDWVALFRRLNIRLANLFLWFINGSFEPRFAGVRQAIETFKTNGITCQLHCYSDLIEMGATGLDYRVDANGKPVEFYGHYAPTPAAGKAIAANLANAYVEYGLDGGIYMDAIDWHALTNTRDDGIVFQYRVVDAIPGGCPLDVACKWANAWPLLSRWGAIDSPKNDMRAFVDKHSKFVEQAGYISPFMGWLDLNVGWTVNDIYVYLLACRHLGASYAISQLTPSNVEQYADLVDALAFYNELFLNFK